MQVATNENDTNLYLKWAAEAALQNAQRFEEKMGPYSAEIVPGTGANWHAVIPAPAHERVAAAHLVARGFGIYLPEIDVTIIRRGRKVDLVRLLIPGYLFVYVWDIARHVNRIRACPGVMDFLKADGQIRVIPWSMIDQLRVIENQERPLSLPMDEVIKPRKKRWRRSRKEIQAVPAEIIGIHAYSPMMEEMRQAGIDDAARISAFNKALGLS